MRVTECLVVPTNTLIAEGLIPEPSNIQTYYYRRISGFNDIRRILSTVRDYGSFEGRFDGAAVENNPLYQQLIMYGFVVGQDNRFLIYQRGGQKVYDESRLRGKESVGIGGHMVTSDTTLVRAFYRKLSDELQINIDGKQIILNSDAGLVQIKKLVNICPVGLLKDNRDEIGKVHLGVVCRITPRSDKISILTRTDRENTNSRYLTLDEYTNLVISNQINPESWTDIVVREEIFPLFTDPKRI